MTEREARHLVRNLQSTLGLAHHLLKDERLSAKKRAMAEKILTEALGRIEQAKPFMNPEDRAALLGEADR